MQNIPYIRTEKEKCPNCGTYGQKEAETNGVNKYSCPRCQAVFTRWAVVKQGKEVPLVNS